MKNFKDWSIRYKLIVPLLAVMVLGGTGIVWTFVGMYDEITADALPEERALYGIRRASLELLSEYREFMIVQSDSTQREIDELKKEIEVYEAAFERTAGSEKTEAPFVEAIEASVQKLKQLGDEAITVRRRLLDQIGALEVFEADIENLPAGGPADAGDAATRGEPMETGEIHELRDLLHEYLSELREYALAPSNQTRQEISVIERSLEQISRAGDDDPASELEDQAGNTAERILIQRLIETGHITVALTNDFLTKLETLEETENDLLDVLEKAVTVIAAETDVAFETGFAAVATVIIAVLALIVLVGYMVSQGIATRIPQRP